MQALGKAYERFADQMSYFVISELLGEYYLVRRPLTCCVNYDERRT